ncbi:hypothetical protein J437_LFUL001655 [Ladona fulva]|uniref:Integrase catalytic domain-containing protein n=1 Tax=Ladona fulva TaxID=123851 RepID=A0A8K0K3G4_LADFU|nr:hypothetical protein J437_LFUL001655 [Ladona fulva]
MQKHFRSNFYEVVNDIFSKYAWAIAIRNKTCDEIMNSFNYIFKTSRRKPLKFQSDKEKEFINRDFQKFLTMQSIKLYHNKLLSNYNKSIHSSFGIEPSNVSDATAFEVAKKIRKYHSRNSPKLQVGNHVQISKERRVFKKCYTPNYSTEIFRVHTASNNKSEPTYKMDGYEWEIN